MKLKYLNTVLRHYRFLSVTYPLLEEDGHHPEFDIAVVSSLIQQHLSWWDSKSDTPPPSSPPPPPCLVSSTVVSLSLPSEAIRRGAPSVTLYFFPLFIATTLLPPLTTSFCNHHVAMRDAGSKSPSLQHPHSQLASSNQ